MTPLPVLDVCTDFAPRAAFSDEQETTFTQRVKWLVFPRGCDTKVGMELEGKNVSSNL